MGSVRRPRLGEDGEFSRLVPSLSVRYAFDVYHEDPTRPRDVQLLEYTLHLRGDRAAAEGVLRARFGEPLPVVERYEHQNGTVSTTEYGAYHPFYVTDSRRGDFTLEWFATVPRFAVPEPDAQLRRAWLAELHARLKTARSVDEIDAFCRAAPAAVGIEVVGVLNNSLNPVSSFQFPLPDARDYWVRFVPPVGALVLVEAFDLGPAVGVSTDVHLSSWRIQRRGARRPPTTGALDHWEVHAHLTKWPSGPRVPDAASGPSTPYGIGEADEVRSLSVQPRFFE